MKPPVARTLSTSAEDPARPVRAPRVFAPETAQDVPAAITAFEEEQVATEPEPGIKRVSLLGRVLWTTGSLLVSLALGLALDALLRNLFAANPWLGWVGVALLVAFVVAALALILREYLSLRRLHHLDRLRRRASEALLTDRRDDGAAVVAELRGVYTGRADLARARDALDRESRDLFDGAELVRLAERRLLSSLDAEARALTAASARRVTLVTAVSPRALIDVGFVIFESVRLGGAIARLYGARPGVLGTWRLLGAILAHLAVTGGLVLTDGLVEQLVGQGLAARLSARLGEGIVNGLMTVRVGIAAIRVVRPLPFSAQPQPLVRDFIPELVNVTKANQPPA